MFAVPVTEDVDIVEDVGAHLLFVAKDMISHGSRFIATEERFHRRIVVAVALGAHTRVHFEAGEHALITI